MKIIKIIIEIIVIFLLLTIALAAQGLNVHMMIGKSQGDLIRLYGKPIHQDNSDPSMVCMFYEGDNFRYIFVSDANGVYQSEGYNSYNTENSARSELDDFISNSISNGFKVDTVSSTAFQLQKPGVSADLQLIKNEISKKFEVNVKAAKREG
jgi:hypothetical protein